VRPSSAGLLLFRRAPEGLLVLLVHPGGPFWRRKDLGAWTIPKGELAEGEAPKETAFREFREETGWVAPHEAVSLGHVRQAGGKVVHAWAVEGHVDPATLCSNTFEVEWPRGSGRRQRFAEVDKAGWFTIPEARRRILPAQAPLLDALTHMVDTGQGPGQLSSDT